MNNTSLPIPKERKVSHNGRTYVSIIHCRAESPTQNLTRTSGKQWDELGELFGIMTLIPPPFSYRQYATANRYTIVEKTDDNGRNYRIDNQIRLEMDRRPDRDYDPKLNIQYQIGRNSHAMVLVRMTPIECPPDITVGLIDEDRIFGFSPRVVMGFIEKALKFSAAMQCCTFIEWTIRQVGRIRPPPDMPNFTLEDRSGDRSRDAVPLAAIKVTAKLAAENALKYGTKTALKKTPLVGLICGTAFGVGRLINGDPFGAVGELASGAVSCLPGPGTAASLAIDAGLLARDLSWDSN